MKSSSRVPSSLHEFSRKSVKKALIREKQFIVVQFSFRKVRLFSSGRCFFSWCCLCCGSFFCWRCFSWCCFFSCWSCCWLFCCWSRFSRCGSWLTSWRWLWFWCIRILVGSAFGARWAMAPLRQALQCPQPPLLPQQRLLLRPKLPQVRLAQYQQLQQPR